MSTAMDYASNLGTVSQHVVEDVLETRPQPLRCEVCEITCNSEDVLEKHKQGKRHLKSLQKLTDSSANGPKMLPPPVAIEASVGELENKPRVLQNAGSSGTIISCNICNVVCANQDIFQQHVAGKIHSVKPGGTVSETRNMSTAKDSASNLGTVSQNVVEDVLETRAQPLRCEVCEITCNSADVLEKHKQGKRHLKSLHKLTDSSANAPKMLPPPVEIEASVGELENKHRVLQNGGSSGTIMSCNICNVVSANQDIYQKHVAGKINSAKAGGTVSETRNMSTAMDSASNLSTVSQHVLEDVLETRPQPLRCEAGATVSETRNMSTAMDSASNLGTVSQHVVEDVLETRPQPLRCELCDITCFSADVLEKHKQGKRHLKSLQKLTDSSANAPKMLPPPVAVEASVGELENKHRVFQNGGSSGTIRSCNICNVVCANQDIYQKHVAGKIHSAKAGGTVSETRNMSTAMDSASNLGTVSQHVLEDVLETRPQPLRCEAGRTVSETRNMSTAMDSASNLGTVSQHVVEDVLETRPQPLRCEVCDITCYSADVLEKHKQGKRHLKSLQKLTDSSANAPKMLPPPVAVEASVGELENKHRVLQNGGSTGTVISCNICNVVCANQDIYQKHVAGKMHSAKAIMLQASTSGVFDRISASGDGSQKKPETLNCGLCKISCPTNELLTLHMQGKKHLKKLKESGQIPNLPSNAVSPLETPTINPVVNPESDEGKIVKPVVNSESNLVWCELCGLQHS